MAAPGGHRDAGSQCYTARHNPEAHVTEQPDEHAPARRDARPALTRREFGTLVAAALAAAPGVTLGQPQNGGALRSAERALDIADWSYFWYGVETARLARGTLVNGAQMYVEHWIPREVGHPCAVVLIHGGYGQGTDWISTPDGRRGWVSLLIEQGHKVYCVDRPGQGRNPYHPWVNGAFDPQAPTFERVAATVGNAGGQQVAAHTQWPGPGDVNDPAIAQIVASRGQPMAINDVTLAMWGSRGALLLDEVGPAVLVTHGDGALFAWAAARERPDLVRAIVAVEPSAPSLQPRPPGIGSADAGLYEPLLTIPICVVSAEASASDAADSKLVASLRNGGTRVEHIRLGERGIRGNGPMPMAEKNNREVLQPVLDWLGDTVDSAVRPGAPAMLTSGIDPNLNRESTAVRLADQGGFWVGVQKKRMPYGTIALGQMFVQYMIPAERRYPYPIVMVHGGGGQGTHMMGIGGRPGWVHYFVQAGYSVYWVDRPSYGRSPYHPDALGPSHLPVVPPYEPLVGHPAVFNTGQWPGSGGMNDPIIVQFMACESGNVSDEAFHSELVWPGGVEILERTGPGILLTHAFGGFFGWGVADRRPDLVKGIMCMEINGNPFERQLRWGITAAPIAYDPPVTDPAQFTLADHVPPPDSPRPVASPYRLQAEPARRIKNLQGIPIGWLTSEFGAGGSPVANVAFLKQAGLSAEMIRLRDFGIRGNGNLMLLERNNHEVFAVIRDWLDTHVAPPGPSGASQNVK
jgi:pimeloyl-ACP methyl ester carboxylesterase